MEIAEHARESVEHVHEHGPPSGFAKRVALLVGVLAAVLAMTEIAGQHAQTEYIAHNIAASDNWTFYGFKETRARIAEQTAVILGAAQPGTPDPARQDAIAQARAVVTRMHDGDAAGPGTRDIQKRAQDEQAESAHALHEYHLYEYASGALQLAIVLASAAVVTGLSVVAVTSGVLGGLAALAALAVGAGLF